MKPKVCIDRPLPWNAMRPLRTVEVASPRGLISRAVAPNGKQWINGSILRVRFLEGTDAQRQAVIREVNGWQDICNVKIEFNQAPDAEIRIQFNPDDGAWSYIGTDAKYIALDQPTMNLGWLEEGVITHEFMHALGLGHEHQNPTGGIEWNEEQVIKDLSGPPNFWDEQTIRHNVLRKYSVDQVRSTQFDRDSVMLYFFPASWTRNGVATKANAVLSDTDKVFLKTMMYPFPHAPVVPAVRLSPNAWLRTKAEIGVPGEEDLYVFTVDQAGLYTINTTGTSDVVLRLYGPEKQTLLLMQDDNSGVGRNAQVRQELMAGDYWVQVRHSDAARGTGKYTIKVRRHK